MKKRYLILIVIAWCLLTIVNYYIVPYFIVALEWVVFSLFFFILAISQLFRLLRERKSPDLIIKKVISTSVIIILFLLTFFHKYPHSIIEKMDWYIFFNRRVGIVDEIRKKELQFNENIAVEVYELPYKFPIVSNGGNDILIKTNKDDRTITISFFVFRNFFSSPSTYFVYTDNTEEIIKIEKRIKYNPDKNWKIKNNWYRTYYE